jgi:lipopolysaccharide transport system ATP-binding protein
VSEYAIEVLDLRKKFCRSLKRSLLYGTTDVARAMAGFPNQNPELRKSEFWALDGISFQLKRGESLGLIGANGCGKSTLLRLLSGIFPPDQGEIQIRGRMASLIAVGAGFHPHMSGAENIYLNGVLLGLSRNEIRKRFEDIVEFAEIGEFIEAPVSTYSSGMRVRLGFSIAVHTKPEILLVDEVMSVGDTRFRRKASDAMTNLLDNSGTTLILVSHNAFTVKQQCDAALLMDHGKEIFYGDVDEAYQRYHEIGQKADSAAQHHLANADYTFFRVSSGDGDHKVRSGEPFVISFGLRQELIGQSDLPLTITVFDADNAPVLSLQTASHNVAASDHVSLEASPVHLKDGTYSMQCKLGSSFRGTSVFRGYQFTVTGNPRQCHTAVCVNLESIPATDSTASNM